MPGSDDVVYRRGDVYHVECPVCGVPEGEECVEMTHKGAVGGYRSPHQRRAKLAREEIDDARE